MTRRRWRAPRLLLSLWALWAGLAGPSMAVLHGWVHAETAHAREAHGWEAQAREAYTRAGRVMRAARAPVAVAGGAHLLAAPAHLTVVPTLDARDHDGDDHPAMHANVLAKLTTSVAAVLPARAPPVVAIVLAAMDRLPTPVSPDRPPPRAQLPSAPSRAPPLG